MRDEPNVLGLLKYNSLNYEHLKGDKLGLSSVKVNEQYRIEFEEETENGETIATVCYITDLSNHYKQYEIMINTNKRFYSPDMVANNLTPAFPTHPGTILKEEIEYRGLSQHKLAKEIGLSYSVLNGILNGHRPLTEKTAYLIAGALDVNPEPLIKLQKRYDVQTADNSKKLPKRLSQTRNYENERLGL